MQFSQYVRWEGAQQQSSEFAAAEEYWLKQFAGTPPVLELPGDRPRPSVKTYRGSTESVTLEASLYDALKRVGAKRGARFYDAARRIQESCCTACRAKRI